MNFAFLKAFLFHHKMFHCHHHHYDVGIATEAEDCVNKRIYARRQPRTGIVQMP